MWYETSGPWLISCSTVQSSTSNNVESQYVVGKVRGRARVPTSLIWQVSSHDIGRTRRQTNYQSEMRTMIRWLIFTLRHFAMSSKQRGWFPPSQFRQSTLKSSETEKKPLLAPLSCLLRSKAAWSVAMKKSFSHDFAPNQLARSGLVQNTSMRSSLLPGVARQV